eukprot:517573-Rhodomonas_salina.1
MSQGRARGGGLRGRCAVPWMGCKAKSNTQKHIAGVQVVQSTCFDIFDFGGWDERRNQSQKQHMASRASAAQDLICWSPGKSRGGAWVRGSEDR